MQAAVAQSAAVARFPAKRAPTRPARSQRGPFQSGLKIVGLTGDNFVRLPLISRNTQRRWIAVSRQTS